jgi:hypothetical protein
VIVTGNPYFTDVLLGGLTAATFHPPARARPGASALSGATA